MPQDRPRPSKASPRWAGEVANAAALPTTGNRLADVRVAKDTFIPWIWNGSAWQHLAALVGSVEYQGTWNAATNSPALASGVGTKGHYYVVSVSGNTNLDGITDWVVGDWAIFNGTVWEKADHTDVVSSVFGRQGAVIAAASDYDASQVDNDSGVPGATVKDALDNIVGRLTQELGLWLTGPNSPSRVFMAGTDVQPFELDSGKDIQLSFELSDSIDLSVDPVLPVLFTPTVVGTGDGTIALRLTVRYVAPGTENLDKVVDETLDVTPTVTNVFGRLHTVDITLDKAKMAVGDCITMTMVNLGTGSYDGTVGIIRNQKIVYGGV